MSKTISLVGLNKAAVLAALYNAARPQGMGFVQYSKNQMTVEEAQVYLDAEQTNFDYLNGRVMKVDLSGDELNPWLYDRDNGEDAAWTAIEALRQTGNANAASIQIAHNTGKEEAADHVMRHIDEETTLTEGDDHVTLKLGYKDVAEPLKAAVKKATGRQ